MDIITTTARRQHLTVDQFGTDRRYRQQLMNLTKDQSGQYASIQSKLFSIEQGVNPLVAAAAPLLELYSELDGPIIELDIQELYQLLVHEMKTFEAKALANNFGSQTILAARYLLCSFFDDAIQATAWGKKNNWAFNNLLSTFHREPWGGEKFFLILERCSEKCSDFIELLELGYLLLRLGYLGQYRDDLDLKELSLICDNLYQLIEDHRGEHHSSLFVKQKQKKAIKRLSLVPPVWVTVSVAGVMLCASFFGYQQHLNKKNAAIMGFVNANIEHTHTHTHTQYTFY